MPIGPVADIDVMHSMSRAKVLSGLLLVIVAVLSCMVSCKDTMVDYGSIAGYVTDANNGEPLRNVDVTLSPVGLSAVSGSDGRYEFLDLAEDRYTVQASKPGYVTNTKVVDVRRGKVASGDIMLTRSYSDMSLNVSQIDFGASETVHTFQIINNASNGSFAWSITKMGSADWLTITPISGNTTAGSRSLVTLTIDRSQISSPVMVNLRITNTNSGSEITLPVSVGYNSNTMTVSPTTVDFGTSSVSKSITIYNTGSSSISYEISYNCAWLTVNPDMGVIGASSSKVVTLSLNRSALSGNSNTTLQVRNVTDGSVVSVYVYASTTGGGGEIVIPGGLMAYYTFDNGDGTDFSENSIDASLVHEPSLPDDGHGGHYLSLNAIQGQYMNIPYNLFYGLYRFSVSFWIKDFNPGCIFSGQTSANNSTYDAPALWATQDNKFWIKCSNEHYAGYSFSYNYVTEGIQSGGWHHVVVVYNSNAILYIDGNRVDQGTPNFNQGTINGCTKVVFGGNKDGSYSYSGNMKLDNIRIYNRALNQQEIQTIYNNEL